LIASDLILSAQNGQVFSLVLGECEVFVGLAGEIVATMIPMRIALTKIESRKNEIQLLPFCFATFATIQERIMLTIAANKKITEVAVLSIFSPLLQSPSKNYCFVLDTSPCRNSTVSRLGVHNF
jgi:hypothetical protein